MTKLIVQELDSSLTHIASTNYRMVIGAVRPYLYKHLSPSGTFTISIIQNSVTLGSKSLTSTEIESLYTDITNINYAHGPIKFEFDNPIVVNRGAFSIQLSSSGYSFSENAYFGWTRKHEGFVNIFTDPNLITSNPLSVEVWTWNNL